MWALYEIEIWKCDEIVSSKFQRNINSDFGQDSCVNWEMKKEILLTVLKALYHFERNMF